jgi:FkbM family methyltransferase
VCIEPHPENYEIACANTKNYPNIIVLNAALTAQPGTINLFDRGTGNWGYTIISTPRDISNPEELGHVECVTVEQIIDDYQKTGIDILKLDVEGAEREILENAGSWMPRCEILLAELHERIVPGCLRAYIHATEGRIDISSQGEKAISLRDGMRHSAPSWETEGAPKRLTVEN